MHTDLSRNSLLIVSDTAMWVVNNEVWVFEPALREVESLAEMFDRVTWVGYDRGSVPKGLARGTVKINVDFVLLPFASGGSTFFYKLRIVPFIPRMLITILKGIANHQYIYTRGPSVPALITLLISCLDRQHTYWHKYAGDWKQPQAPWAYALQRFLLRHGPHKVTINGTWVGEPSNIINMDNPCLTKTELSQANEFAFGRQKPENINLCFVGALTQAKGIHQFVDALFILKTAKKVGHVYIAGDGSERKALEEKAIKLPINVTFLGNLRRDAINKVYRDSQIIILPSDSEGFPKVIAEASAFGCVPIVTDVSAIGQYIKNGKNGLLLPDNKSTTIAKALDYLINDFDKIEEMSKSVITLSSLFTYERFCRRIKELILNK